MSTDVSRRDFLKFIGVAGVAAGLAACQPQAQAPTDMPGMSDSQTASPQGQADDMDKMHEAGVKKFVELIGKDEKFWKFPLEYKMDGDVKVFELVAEDIDWLVAECARKSCQATNGRDCRRLESKFQCPLSQAARALAV